MSKRPISTEQGERIQSTSQPSRPPHVQITHAIPETLASASAQNQRVVLKRSKLALGLLPKSSQSKLSIRPSAPNLKKEDGSVSEAGVVSDFEHRRSKLKSRLGGSASKVGGLGSMVRHASRGLLKDITNAEPVQADEAFVNVGIEDAIENEKDKLLAKSSTLTEAERNALEGNDPDIAEIVVVKRPKNRALPDPDSAQGTQDMPESTDGGVSMIATTDTETRAQRSLNGWWNKGMGKKHDAIVDSIEIQNQQRPPFVSTTDGQPTMHKKGSLVLKAVRSVRSLAQFSSISNLRSAETNDKGSDSESKSKVKSHRPVAGPHLRKKTPLPMRRPTNGSNSSWEAGGLSSSERSARNVLLLPRSETQQPVVSRTASEARAIMPVAHTLRRTSHPINIKSGNMELPRQNIRFDSEAVSQVNKRLSVISTDSMTDSAVKENRRASTGSTIRWDPEAVSPQAKKERLEERRRLKAQRKEAERMNGTPIQERKEKSSSSARRRTPLTAVFDLDMSSSSTHTLDPNVPKISVDAPVAIFKDPILAATEALLRAPPKERPLQTEKGSVEAAYPRLRSKESKARPRPVGIVAVDEDKDDATLHVLNAANADLQTFIGTLTTTPDGTPSVPPTEPASPVPAKDRSVSEPLQRSNQIDDQDEALSKLSRRVSGSSVARQVAAWPPVPMQKEDSLSTLHQQRERTASSSSNPPSAFRLSLSEKESKSESGLTSVTLRTLKSEQGNVQKKARYYGELDREAKKNMASMMRKASVSESLITSRSRRRKTSSPAPDTTNEAKGDNESPPSVDVVTDIPKELTEILFQSPLATIQDSISPERASVCADAKLPTPSIADSASEFVYTGVDAQEKKSVKALSSVARSSEYSFCNWLSYSEINRPEVAEKQAASSTTPTSSDVFVDTKRPTLRHRTDQSIASVHSVDSYCVVSKRPPLREAPPLVMHGKHASIDSGNTTAENTFTFAEKFPENSGRSAHQRAQPILSVASGESAPSFAALERPGINTKFFVPNDPLLSTLTSPSKEQVAKINAMHEPTSPSTIPPSSAGSMLDAGYTSSESLFDKPRQAMSSTSSIASVFAPNFPEQASCGNLFSKTRPKSLVSNYSDIGVTGVERVTPVRCLDGEVVKAKAFEPASPCEQVQKNRSARPPPLHIVNTSETQSNLPSPPLASSPIKVKPLDTGSKPAVRVRPRGSGHRRSKTPYNRPLTITEPICETQEEAPDLCHSASRSRGSSNTTTDTTNSLPDSATQNAEPEPETSMVLRRYYTLQREAQEEIEHSRSLWEDTPYSFEELSSFQSPTEPEAIANFLDYSRRLYFELPAEMRARRRALAAPYTVPIGNDDAPESPVVDVVFKDLSTWDHRRGRKASDEKPRSRKVSEEKVRARKVSEEKGRVRKVSEGKGRTRKVSEKRTRKKSAPSNAPSLPSRAFTPFVDAASAPLPVKLSEDGAKLESAPLSPKANSLGRSKTTAKIALKLDTKAKTSMPTVPSKENTLKTKHSNEGLLESPAGSLRIARPRPPRRVSTASPPASLRL